MSGRVRFGEVVRKVNDKIDPVKSGVERYVAGEHMDTDEPRIHRWGTVGNGYLGPAFHMRFKPGHILYGSRRTYLRKVAMADFAGVCANTTYVLEPSTPHLLPEFLLLVMSTERFHQNSISLSKGSTNPYINFSDIEPFEFDLPSVEKQHQVIQMINGVDDHSAHAASLIQSIQHTRRVLTKRHLAECALVGKSMKLGDIAILEYGAALREDQRATGDVLVFGSSGIVGAHSVANFGPGPVVVIGRKGNAGSVYWSDRACWVIDTAYVVKLKIAVDLAYVYRLLAAFDLSVLSAHTAIPGLSRERVYELEVCLPSEGEQADFVAKCAALDEFMRSAHSHQVSTNQLRRSLLNKELS